MTRTAETGALRVRELTPTGAGGVSVLRIEGPGALARVRALARDPRGGHGTGLGRGPGPSLVRLAAEGEDLDEALCVVLAEECVELHLHGSPPLVARVRELLGTAAVDVVGDLAAAAVARPATLEARAELLLAAAPGEAAARILLDQTQGALRRALEALAAVADTPAFTPALDGLRERGRVAARALVPARVVLAGPANAGKSTLFNALFGRLRVIVSSEAGTTRDAVCERIAFGAYPVDLYDTAGEREVPGVLGAADAAGVEREGQSIGRSLRGSADLVLWLCPVDDPAGEPPPGAVCLTSRVDLAPGSPGEPGAAGPAAADLGAADSGAGTARPGLSAEADPAAAARVCAAEFHAHLDLPAEPWQPGTGAPFDAALRADLAALGTVADAARRRARIETLLQG